MSLMDMIKGAVSKQVMGQIGGILGTDEKKTASVFDNAAGSILGGLIKKSGTPNGSKDIFDMATKQDDGILDKLGDILGNKDATADLQKSGGGVLDGIFGSQQTGMVGTIAKALGLEGNVMGTLMKMLAPIVMGVIGRHIKSKAMDAVGLGSFLGEQKSSLGFMPSSLTEGLGFGNLLGNVGDAGKAALGAATGAVGNVAGAASGAMENVAGAASGAVGSVGDMGKAALGSATGAVGNVAGAASGAVGSAGDMGKAALGSAGDAAGKAGGGLAKLLIPLALLAALAFGAYKVIPMLSSGAGDMAKSASDKIGDLNMKMPEIPGMDLKGIEGFDMGSLGVAGPKLAEGFGSITSGFEGLKDEAGATQLAEKITGFTGTIDGLGLDKLDGVAKTSATGLIGKFVETVKGLLGGQSEGIKGILQPAVDGLMAKFKGFMPGA